MPGWQRARLGLTFLAAVVAIVGSSAPVLASGTNPYTGSGADISYPQCGAEPAQGPGSFVIVGATGGRAFRPNSCLAEQVAWAKQWGVPITYYTNLNYAVGSTADQGLSGYYGNCKRSDKRCQARNYGDNAAAYAFGQVQTAGGNPNGAWWLDIETANSWSTDLSLNVDVISAALAYFQRKGLDAGIYSTSSMWNKIAGSYAPSVPNWVVQSAGATCSTPLYAGASVWLLQTSSGTTGGDHACP